MRTIYNQNKTFNTMSKNKKSSGYICPFIKGDCIHMDSSSMSNTVNCHQCENFILKKKMDIGVIMPELTCRTALRILTN